MQRILNMLLLGAIMVLAGCGGEKPADSGAGDTGSKEPEAKSFQAEIDALASDDAREVRESVNALKAAGKEAMPALLKALKSSEEQAQRKAVELLGQPGWSECAEPLAQVILSGTPPVRSAAAVSLNAVGGEAALKAATSLLQAPDYKVRVVAIGVMKQLDLPGTVPVLLDALVEKHGGVRNVLFDAIASKGQPAVDALEKKLAASDDINIKRQMIVALGRTRSDKVAATLLKVLAGDEARLKNAAACALSDVKSVDAVAPLMTALEDENAAVRACAARALGSQGDATAVPALIDILKKDQVPHVQAMAAHGLGKLADDRAVKALVGAMGSETRSVRYHSISALSNFKAPVIPPVLVKVLGDPDVGQHAVLSLVKIGEIAVPHLLRVLRQNDEKAVAGAVLALGRIGDKKAVDPLVKRLAKSEGELAGKIADALRRLTGKNFGTDAALWKSGLSS